MRLHLLEHDPLDFSCTNISIWAEKKQYELAQTYVCKGEILPDVREFDWLMVMGGSQHVWEEDTHPWLPDEKRLIARAIVANKTVLGVCFGAQLLAETLGGKVFRNEYKEIGWYPVSLTPEGRESFLFEGVADPFVTFHWHHDHYSLPPRCVGLARSQATATQAFADAGRPLVGIQFHPEYTLELIRYFSHEHSEDWEPDLYVAGKDPVLARTEEMDETYGLMEALLNNMDREFHEVQRS
jgi:GMP synthase-like glutamine amidotransferase